MLSESPGQTDAHSIATSSDQSIFNPVVHPMANESMSNPENNHPDDSNSISSSVEEEGKTRDIYRLESKLMRIIRNYTCTA